MQKNIQRKETQIYLAGDLGLIEKGELGTLKKDIAEIERMLKALTKSLENKPSNPWTLSNQIGEEPTPKKKLSLIANRRAFF